MNKIIVTILFSLSLYAASAFAFPPVATLHTYYNASGTEIGWRFLGCTGGSSSGQTSGYASVEVEVIATCGGRGGAGR